MAGTRLSASRHDRATGLTPPSELVGADTRSQSRGNRPRAPVTNQDELVRRLPQTRDLAEILREWARNRYEYSLSRASALGSSCLPDWARRSRGSTSSPRQRGCVRRRLGRGSTTRQDPIPAVETVASRLVCGVLALGGRAGFRHPEPVQGREVSPTDVGRPRRAGRTPTDRHGGDGGRRTPSPCGELSRRAGRSQGSSWIDAAIQTVRRPPVQDPR